MFTLSLLFHTKYQNDWTLKLFISNVGDIQMARKLVRQEREGQSEQVRLYCMVLYHNNNGGSIFQRVQIFMSLLLLLLYIYFLTCSRKKKNRDSS
jgi:hypothetical protein